MESLMESTVDYFKILNVKCEANDNEIRKSYLKLAKKWHPDKNNKNSIEAENKFKLIQKAYEILSDQTLRMEYLNKQQINQQQSQRPKRQQKPNENKRQQKQNENESKRFRYDSEHEQSDNQQSNKWSFDEVYDIGSFKIYFVNTTSSQNESKVSAKYGNGCAFRNGTNFIKSNIKFGDGCVFNGDCDFNDNCMFGNGSMFLPNCTFKDNCVFSKGCFFENNTKFGDNCVFGMSCYFGKNCQFGNNCKFDVGCTLSSGYKFGNNCTFNYGCSVLDD